MAGSGTDSQIHQTSVSILGTAAGWEHWELELPVTGTSVQALGSH